MNKKTQEKVSHQHNTGYDTTLAFGISNVLQILRSGTVNKQDVENQRKVDAKKIQSEVSLDSPNKKLVIDPPKQFSIEAFNLEDENSASININPVMKKEAQRITNHQQKSRFETGLAFDVSNVPDTLHSRMANEKNSKPESASKLKPSDTHRDQKITGKMPVEGTVNISNNKSDNTLIIDTKRKKTQHQVSGQHKSSYDTTLAFGVSDVLAAIRSGIGNKHDKKRKPPRKVRQSSVNENPRKREKLNFKSAKDCSNNALAPSENPICKRYDFKEGTSSFDRFLNMPNISLNKGPELNLVNELKRVGRDLDLDMLKMKEMLKNRIQSSIVLVIDDRDEFEISFNESNDHVHVLKFPRMQLKNCFNLIQKHPSYGKGTIFVLICGIHDLLTESILNGCQLSCCPSPQTVFSLPLDTSDLSYLVRMAIDLEFNVLHSTTNDIVLFSGLIPVEIERYNQFISKYRPCFTSHPSSNIPKIDYVIFKNFLLTLDCYNEFTIYHAQKLGFIPWDLHGAFFSSNSILSHFERGLLSEKLSPDGYLIPKEDCILRADKVKELCQKIISLKFSSMGISYDPKEPMLSSSCTDIYELSRNASVQENLLNTTPFNKAQKPKKYDDNQLRRFDPVLAFDLHVMREVVCRRSVNNIVLVTDEREDIDIPLEGFDARINVFNSTGIQMKNAIDFVKKHFCFGKGTIFIVFCGIHDFLNSVILEDCVRHGCPFPQTLFTLAPNVIDNNYLIKTAMALNFEILSSTANDIALFCGLIPVDIGKYNMYTCMNRPCLAIHPALSLPLLDNFTYKSFISAVESYNDFTKRHAQSLGFTPWDLEVSFFDYGPGSANRESNFIFQKMGMNGSFLTPQDNQNRVYAVKLLCQNLLPQITSVVSGQALPFALTGILDKPPWVDKNKVLDDPQFVVKNEALCKYSDSQLENVKYIYQNDLSEIMTSMNGRTQNSIVIVSDERDNFDISLVGYDSRVSILKVPGIKFSNALSSIKSHSSFGMGTIFIFSCGTHDLLQTVSLQECLHSHCPNPQTVLRLPFMNIDNHVLIQKALQLNRSIIDSTKNDIVLFCGILPVIMNDYNNYLLDTRTCVASHLSGLVPHLDPILFSCYENSLNWYNNFTKYHAQTLGFEPWDLEIPYFSKIRSVLHTNGFHVCESEDIKRANEAKKLFLKLFQKLSANKKAVHSPAAAMTTTRPPASSDSNVLIETDILSAKKKLIAPVKSVILPDSNLKNNMPADQCMIPALKTHLGIPGKTGMSAAVSTQIDPDTSAFDCEIVSKYSQIVFVADKQYRSILKHFKHPNVTLMADEHLKLNDIEEYLVATMRKAPRAKTLYLIVTGIHTFTTTDAANLCLLKSCKNPLQAISYVAIEEFCNLAKICGKKLLTIISNLKGHIPMESNIAILPPLPLQLVSMNISHKNLHAGISLFPDYVIANFEFAVRKYYPMWMDSISSLALTSFVNCNLQHSCFQRIITDQYKKVEMIENFETCSSEANTKWKKLIADIIGIILEDYGKLDRFINDEFYFDHLVFILSPASLKLLPDITAYTKYVSIWHIDDIAESRNIFSKINELNKMALKSVLFIVLSDVTMVALVEQHPYCIVRNCEHKLSFCRLQSNSTESKTFERKLCNLLSSIKIIISEIKMLSNFMSKIIIAPFTPKIYTLFSDTNDEKQHNEMHEYMQKKNYTSFLYGTTTSNWADLLLSFSIKWKLLAKQILCKDGGGLIEFMDVINAEVANLTLISWRSLSECSFDADYNAFSSWQSCILVIIQKALKKHLPLQTTVDYVEPKFYFLQHKSQDPSLSHSHLLKTQKQHLTKNKAIISYDACQNTAKNSGTLVNNRITDVSEKHNLYVIADDISQISPILGVGSHGNHQIEETRTNNINLVIQGTNSVCRKEDKVAVVGNSSTDKALFQENLPMLPVIGNLMKSATPKEVNSVELAMLNKTLGSSSASLEIPLMPNYENIKCSTSEIYSKKSNRSKTLLDDTDITSVTNSFHTRYAQSTPRSITPKSLPNPDMKFASDSMHQEQKSGFITVSSDIGINTPEQAKIETLPIMPIIRTGIKYHDHPVPRVYRSQYLVPIICKEADSDEHNVKRETTESSNLNTPSTCLDSSEHSNAISSYTDQSICKKPRSQYVSPNKRTISFDHVNMKSECISPSTKEELRSISIAIKKEIISPENLKTCAFESSFLSTKRVTPERRTIAEQFIMEQSTKNIPKGCVHNPEETSSESYSASKDNDPNALSSKIQNATTMLKSHATEHVVTKTLTVPDCKTLTLTGISDVSKKILSPSDHFVNFLSEIESKKSRLTSAIPEKYFQGSESLKLSISNKNKNLISETKEIKLTAEYSDFMASIPSPGGHSRLSTSSSKKHTLSPDRADYKSHITSKENQKQKPGSLVLSKKRNRSPGDSDSKSHLHFKSKKLERSRSRSSSHHKKSRFRSSSYHKKSKDKKKSKSKRYHKKSRSRSTSYPKKSRSRSTSYHKKSRSRSTSNHKKSKYVKKSKSEHYHKKSRFKPTSEKHKHISVENSTVEEDLINQRMQAALRKQIGEKLFKDYTKVLSKMRVTFEMESLAYKMTPEKHPNFKKIYKVFKDMNSAHGNVDKHHVKKLWKLFWGSQYEDIKSEDWKARQIKLIKEYEQKVPSKSSFLLSKPSISGNKTTTFSFDKALILLETLCQKASFMSPAVSEIVKLCQDLGTTTKQAYNIINESENLLLINMVLEKFRNLCSSTADEDDLYLYKMAIDWIPKLLKEAKNNSQISVEEIPIDLQAMALISGGKDSKFMVDLINTALEYEGIYNPSVELVTEIVRKVCAINCT